MSLWIWATETVDSLDEFIWEKYPDQNVPIPLCLPLQCKMSKIPKEIKKEYPDRHALLSPLREREARAYNGPVR
ncbi:MAG: hypothetical protein ACTSQI_19830 [Candidatus Helarchaeota archaeon]